MFTTSHPYSSFTDIHLLLSLDKNFRRVAMILQCFASDGRPLPYFHRGDPGVPGFAGPPGQPGVPGIPPRTSACLTLGSVYPCSLNCIGWYTPWMGATAVAPMILVDWTTQLAQDRAEFAAEPHAQLYPHERAQWMRLYHDLMTYNPDDPRNFAPRSALRKLHETAIYRHNHLASYWASLRPLAPAPPRPNPWPPA